MSRLDDLLRQELPRLAPRPAAEDLFDRVRRRRRARELRRRAGVALLAIAVVGGTSVGTVALRRVFPAAGGIEGTVAFVRLLRPCDGHHVTGGLEVFAVDLATGEQRLVSRGVRFASGEAIPSERWPAFSPDGSFYVWVDHYRGALYRTELPTGETTRIARFPGALRPGIFWPGTRPRIRLSPDGRFVLFAVPTSVIAATAPDGSLVGRDTADIYVVPADGSSEPALVTRGELPVWTPEGEIAFMRTDSTITFQETPGGFRVIERPLPTRFFLVRPDGSDLRQVYEAPGNVRILDADWSPDGSMIAAEVRRGRQSDIYVLDLETREVRRLTDDPANDTSPSWSPDGSMIAFRTGRWGTGPGHSEIAVMSADGSVVRRVTADCWDDHDPTWVQDPSAVLLLPTWTPDVVPTATPAATPSPTPSIAPSPEAAGRDVGLPFRLCHVERLGGVDLLGNGAAGTAWTGAPVGEDGACPEPTEETIVAVDVSGDGLADAWWGPLPHCVSCAPYDATDLDADGDEELVVLAQEASTPRFLLFSVLPGPELAPVTVAPPGHRSAGLPPGEPLSIWTGGDEGFQGAVACEGYPEDPTVVVAWAYHPVEGPGSETTEVHVARLVLQPDGTARIVDASDSTQRTGDVLPRPFGSEGRACGVDFQPVG